MSSGVGGGRSGDANVNTEEGAAGVGDGGGV